MVTAECLLTIKFNKARLENMQTALTLSSLVYSELSARDHMQQQLPKAWRTFESESLEISMKHSAEDVFMNKNHAKFPMLLAESD